MSTWRSRWTPTRCAPTSGACWDCDRYGVRRFSAALVFPIWSAALFRRFGFSFSVGEKTEKTKAAEKRRTPKKNLFTRATVRRRKRSWCSERAWPGLLSRLDAHGGARRHSGVAGRRGLAVDSLKDFLAMHRNLLGRDDPQSHLVAANFDDGDCDVIV